jgi:hypothetical protein
VPAETALTANRLRLIRGCAVLRLPGASPFMLNELLPARRFFET